MRTARDGRMLVECLVAMLLLNATALVVVSLTRAVVAGQERTALTVRAWALAVRDIESATALAPSLSCLPAASSGGDAQPRFVSTWTERTVGALREHEAVVFLTRTPLAGGTTSQLAASAAWSCP